MFSLMTTDNDMLFRDLCKITSINIECTTFDMECILLFTFPYRPINILLPKPKDGRNIYEFSMSQYDLPESHCGLPQMHYIYLNKRMRHSKKLKS